MNLKQKFKKLIMKSALSVIGLSLALSILPNAVLSASAAETTYSITDLSGKYKTQGRTTLVDGVLMLDWSASGIEFIADCQGDIKLTVNSNVSRAFFTVIIDGVTQHADKRVPSDGDWTNIDYPFYITKKGESTFTIAKGLSKGAHRIEIYAQNENPNGVFGIKSISLNGTFSTPPANKQLYIETVGDSIVAGFGNITLAGTPFEWNLHQDATQGFPYLVARELDADWSVLGYSGICASTWGGKIGVAMDSIYTLQRGAQDNKLKYSFERQPDVILVSLGTNDRWKHKEVGATDIDCKMGYVDFLNVLRSKNPNAKIVWLYGMMTGDNSLILSAVKSAGGEDEGFYTLSLPTDLRGGGSHPSPGAQKPYTYNITKYLKELLGLNEEPETSSNTSSKQNNTSSKQNNTSSKQNNTTSNQKPSSGNTTTTSDIKNTGSSKNSTTVSNKDKPTSSDKNSGTSNTESVNSATSDNDESKKPLFNFIENEDSDRKLISTPAMIGLIIIGVILLGGIGTALIIMLKK